jgi:hypothetical protein
LRLVDDLPTQRVERLKGGVFTASVLVCHLFDDSYGGVSMYLPVSIYS